jgi:hypothetical protein
MITTTPPIPALTNDAIEHYVSEIYHRVTNEPAPLTMEERIDITELLISPEFLAWLDKNENHIAHVKTKALIAAIRLKEATTECASIN